MTNIRVIILIEIGKIKKIIEILNLYLLLTFTYISVRIKLTYEVNLIWRVKRAVES